MQEPYGARERAAALLRVTACRYAAFYYLPFWIPFAEGLGRTPPWWTSVLAALFWFVFSLAVETANRISDEAEDRINQPERTRLCDIAGFPLMRRLCLVATVLSLIAIYTTALLQRNLLLALLPLPGYAIGLGYSFGFKLKRLRYTANLLLAMPFVLTFLTGWAVGNPNMVGSGAAPAIAGLLLVAGLFSATVGGVKDITDEAGDTAIGYRSVWVSLRGHVAAAAALYVLAPYAVLVLVVLAGGLPDRFLLLLPLAGVGLGMAHLVRRATTTAAQAAVRELNYHYWYGFLTLALLLWYPTRATGLAAIGCWIYWLLATQYAHWSGGLSAERLRLVWSLLVPGIPLRRATQ
jgi:4-hydroxybenzoate polyprenyltransferase